MKDIKTIREEVRAQIMLACDYDWDRFEDKELKLNLEDALRAMIAGGYYPKMDTSGFALVFSDSSDEALGIWTLVKPLDEQSDDCIRFLASILITN